MKTRTLAVFILGGLLVAACGGGNSSSNGNSSSSSNLSLNTAPTAKLASSQTNANALAAEMQNAAPKLVAAASTQNLSQSLGGLAGVSGSGTATCPASGSFTYTASFSSPPRAGDNGSITFSNCAYDYSGTTYIFNGSASLSYTRYNSLSDYAIQASYSNFSIDITSSTETYTSGQVSGSFTLDDSNGSVTYASNLSDGSATNIASGNVIYGATDITISSATYVYNSPSAGGIIKVVFNNWVYDTSTNTPVSGTVTIYGANGDTVQVDALNKTVSYTINGAMTSYSY